MRVFVFVLTVAGVPIAANAEELSPSALLGKSVFFDTNLSADGVMACAFCHGPGVGFTSPHADINAAGSVVPGAVEGRAGNRKPPSAAYAAFSPVLHHIVEDGEVIFVGGAFLDGRATGKVLGMPVADQAIGPFLNPLEMALPHAACVVQRVIEPADPASYPVRFGDVWGAEAADIAFPEGLADDCRNPDASIEIADEEVAAAIDDAFGKIARSIAAYELSPDFVPFSSRYDAWLAGKGTLSTEELAGLEVFEREDKGNCAACHVLGPNTMGGPTVLTDWTYDNLGVPKNRDNPWYTQAANPEGTAWVDRGLGAFLLTDPVYAGLAEENAGRQQVPTLRNLTKGVSDGVPKAYMHNGYFKTLEGVVRFYNTRDVLPRCKDEWASEAEALAQKCWPAPEIAATVNKDELGNLKLTETEEAALVAFLKTLDDQ
jgi:cytochrome c peroxidase